MHHAKQLILASSSRYRRELLARFGYPFEAVSPDLDERPLPGEAPVATALRLAREKAAAVAAQYPHALVIGSDQVCVINGEAVGKPGNRERAIEQLTRMSGQTITFHTALCLLDPAANTAEVADVPTRVTFRPLSLDEIVRYVDREQPFDCAGSAKIEALGIALLEKVESDDPTAIIGLPLIRLNLMLLQAGLELL